MSASRLLVLVLGTSLCASSAHAAMPLGEQARKVDNLRSQSIAEGMKGGLFHAAKSRYLRFVAKRVEKKLGKRVYSEMNLDVAEGKYKTEPMLSTFGNIVAGGAIGVGAVYLFAKLVMPDLPALEGSVASIPLGVTTIAALEGHYSTRWSRTNAIRDVMKSGTKISQEKLELLGRTKVIDLDLLNKLQRAR